MLRSMKIINLVIASVILFGLAATPTYAGSFSDNFDDGNAGGYFDNFNITSDSIVDPLTNKTQCKNGGWKVFTNPSFKSQGNCVSYLESNQNAGRR